MKLYDTIGWLGAIGLIGEQALLTQGLISVDHWGYYAFNLVAGNMVLLSQLPRHAWPSVALNLAWSCITLMGLWRVLS